MATLALDPHRRCSRCGWLRKPESFAKDASKASGRKSICLDCDKAKSKNYYLANRERKIASSAEHYRSMRAQQPPPEDRPVTRKCADPMCGKLAKSNRHTYCEMCRSKRPYWMRERFKNREPGATRKAGYGWEHRRLRKGWDAKVQAGGVQCARADCKRAHLPGGRLLIPGEPWDLGHDDDDRTKYQGPEHAECNRATAGRRAAKPQGRKSRDW